MVNLLSFQVVGDLSCATLVAVGIFTLIWGWKTSKNTCAWISVQNRANRAHDGVVIPYTWCLKVDMGDE